MTSATLAGITEHGDQLDRRGRAHEAYSPVTGPHGGSQWRRRSTYQWCLIKIASRSTFQPQRFTAAEPGQPPEPGTIVLMQCAT